jgi:uncharacterized damage-inducible protein DinB
MSAATHASFSVLPAEALLAHWQGHRRLTRRLIEAYPEDQLFTFSVGGMRPFGVMVMELISIAAPMVRGVVSNQWQTLPPHETSRPRPKAEILRMWDESTATMNELWPQISQERFGETMTAFGMYPGVAYDLLLYSIDNEIHHRGQGYVFLRALGIAPPPFFER